MSATAAGIELLRKRGGIERWRYYGWVLDGLRTWSDVYVRDNRRSIVAATRPRA